MLLSVFSPLGPVFSPLVPPKGTVAVSSPVGPLGPAGIVGPVFSPLVPPKGTAAVPSPVGPPKRTVVA